MIDVLCTRERAIEHACEIASETRIPTIIVVEHRDGTIERLTELDVPLARAG
jgi:hypothetical protein